ncbi:hypothetical protein CBL_00758 [Carabus blaptoides fortunei]
MDSESDDYNERILEELFYDLDKLPSTWHSLKDAEYSIHTIVQKSFMNFFNCLPTSKQEDENYKNSLLSSLENMIMAVSHEKVFRFICLKLEAEDELMYTKCCDLSALKVTPDQLGALEDYSIPLPATIVELASLDLHETPADKLTCLSTAFDLTLAELKGAIVEVIALTCDNKIPILNVSDITPILATIIIHAKPVHLISNLYYIENFHWSKNKGSEYLLAFKTAVDKLKVVTVDVLLPRSNRIYCDIGLEDVMKMTSNADDKYDQKGQQISVPNNPLDRHIEHFTNMITTSVLDHINI